MSILGFFRETEPTRYVNTYTERFYLEELAHVIVEAWQVQNLMGQARLETQGRDAVQMQGSLSPRFLLALGRSVFVLLRPSTDRMRPTYIMEDNCFTQSPRIEMLFSPLKKHLNKNIRIMSDQIARHYVAAKLTHKMSLHSKNIIYQ